MLAFGVPRARGASAQTFKSYVAFDQTKNSCSRSIDFETLACCTSTVQLMEEYKHACCLYADRLYGRNLCEDRLIKKFPAGFSAIFAASDKTNVHELADRVVGPSVSQRGSFMFERDNAHQWLMDVDLAYSDTSAEVEQVRWAMNRLGSITIVAFAIFYTNKEFSGFRIEASEGGKIRVISSELENGAFSNLPNGFQFKPDWIASVVSDRF
jgi:hypothetical protein